MNLDSITNILIVIEVIASAIFVLLGVREVRYFSTFRSEMRKENLWLLDAITFGQKYLTFTGIYLIAFTGLGAFGVSPATFFPPIRVLNGAVLLGVLYGPYYIGREMRKRRNGKR